ncbi:vitamin K epoxide reductase family protein [Archangium violaceum]|uniref:vitamin K epoxide reductase family protein n=1 Tax=Archangium violaceum TaxID=83451 RepID=UPI001EF15468|nr:vitamin K epoxide reductase family protein [Archangium violaceum]
MGHEHGPHEGQPGNGGDDGHEPSGSGGMGSRGLTRPMSERKARKAKKQRPREQEAGGAPHAMGREERLKMLRMHHQQTLWVYWTVLLLGAWTLLAPLTFGYGKGLVEPSGGRDVWLSLPTRVRLMTWSDIVSGALLLFFGWRALTPNRPRSLWACCFVGIWLSLAPVVLWAPNAAAYLNGTLVGMLVIALTVLIPGMPNMVMYMKMGPATPPGWSYNPSSWPQRWVMIALGFLGFVVSRYLAAFQLGYIDSVWDPFFGDGTRQVLNSNMSHMWPVSDAALGTFAYTFEFLMGFMGSPSRWRTMPWMVTFYGILVIPLGLVHIFLVISQPIVVGEWCTFCLLAAAIMLPMLPLEGDEVVAMGQHLVRAKRRGESLWEVFWKGGSPEGSTQDERSPELLTLPEHPLRVVRAGLWGMSVPWTLAISVVLGVGLVFAPVLLGMTKPAADIFRLAGLLTITVSVIAMGEVFRLARYLNVLLGLGVAAVPWFLGGGTLAGRLAGLLTGLLLVALALPRGPRRERYGSWDRFVR